MPPLHTARITSPGVKVMKCYKQWFSDEQMAKMKAKKYAKNSNRKVKWAVSTYVNWRKVCIETTGLEMCDTDILASNLELPLQLNSNSYVHFCASSSQK